MAHDRFPQNGKFFLFFFCLRMIPDVSYNCKLQLQPHQGALCCLLSTRLLLFLNRKTEATLKGNYVWFSPLGAGQPWQGDSFSGCGIFR
jgi:hypothetical protein